MRKALAILIGIAMMFIAAYVFAGPPTLINSTQDQSARDPLIVFTSFSRSPTNCFPVSAGSTFYDGWVDLYGGFMITNYNTVNTTNSVLRQAFASTHRTNHLARATSEALLDQEIVIDYYHRVGNFYSTWNPYNQSLRGGVRQYTTGETNLTVDRCTNNIALTAIASISMGTTITNGQPLVQTLRATKQAGGITRIIGAIYRTVDWQSFPQGSPLAIYTNTVSESYIYQADNPVAISLSAPSGINGSINEVWVYDRSKSANRPVIGTVSNLSINLGYAGSSTWVVGGTSVPTKIFNVLTNSYQGAGITTYNRALGGTDTSDWVPGSSQLNLLKADIQAATGRKIVRLMIGANDAQVGTSTSTWLSRMQSIINEIRTWPVDDIIVEELGIRLDGGPVYLSRAKAYNAARTQLYGCRLGGATTYENQSTHINLLSNDSVHQTTAGGSVLASNQAAEVTIP